MNRRSFLGAMPGAVLAGTMAQEAAIPIIDTHIHLFDPTRPQGVPWPSKDNAILYKPALPSRFRELTKSLGVVGAIEVECSPWLEDNQWVLEVAAGDTIMVGTVGDLEPGRPDFRRQLDRFHKNPLFRGIRYGYLWGRDLRAQMGRPEFIDDVRYLASADLAFDTANPSLRLLEDIVRLTDKVPDLRVILDHLPSLAPPREPPALEHHQAMMRELGSRPRIFVKVSEVLVRGAGGVITDPAYYQPRLDGIWETFGINRLLYGSDWPNSDPVGTYAEVLHVVRDYFTSKGREAAEKYFWRNSCAAYRWVRRDPAQPDPRAA
jgi:L-fuconolactonase